MKLINLILLLLLSSNAWAQSFEAQLSDIQQEMEVLEQQKQVLKEEMETLKLGKNLSDLKAAGLPSQDYIEHSAIVLEYSEAHEQAKWVGHIITPDIITGRESRTNIFMEDPKVPTGTAVEADYFLKALQADQTYVYDGFGYDRGHLAPSADFRWSKIALAESYFYSNMSPQLPDFNRKSWGELENLLRAYVYNFKEVQLQVFTGPVLEENLPVIERSINKISIPRYYWKVALDLENQRAIAFVMPNRDNQKALENYAVTVDSVEALTGLDFYSLIADNIESKVESSYDLAAWFPEIAAGDVKPIPMSELPRKTYNTIVAAKQKGMNTRIKVVGKVVDGRYTRKGNIILNLDKRYPNQLFSVFIKKENIVNFPFEPLEAYNGKYIEISGKVESLGSAPTMYIESAKAITLYPDPNL